MKKKDGFNPSLRGGTYFGRHFELAGSVGNYCWGKGIQAEVREKEIERERE